jgi:orotate phosphoribosyltransferase
MTDRARRRRLGVAWRDDVDHEAPVLSPLRRTLLEILRTKALRHLDEPVQLASGEWSSDFVDGKEALQEWEDLLLASRAIVETVESAGHPFDAAGGPTLGADALAVGIAAAANRRWYIVRKEPKGRGTARWIEGAQIGDGDRVLLVDDVVTTGGSILKAHEIVTATGAEVVAAVTLVDRGELAAPKFAELGVAYFPMATYEMLGLEPVGLGPGSVPSTR